MRHSGLRKNSWRSLSAVAARNRHRRGSALLTVLWLSAALAAIAFSVSSTVRAETDRVEASSNGLRAWYLATGAVERGIQWMVWGDSFRNEDGTARYWQYNAPRMNMTFPSGTAVVEMIPESAKMNVNRASIDDLTKVIAAVGGDGGRAREIAGAILDWRSGSEGPSPNDQYYFAIGPTFRARHASFEEIEELLFVRGMTPELFYGNFVADNEGALYASGGLRDCFSVWGSLGPFDANTVSPALMAAIGIPPGAISAIVQRRNERPFKDLGEVGSIGAPTGRLGVGGSYIWTLRATARLRRPDGSPSETVRIASATVKLVDRKRFNDAVHVLRWYDDAWSQSAIAPPGPPTQQP
jgi:general secretion pathway protein K